MGTGTGTGAGIASALAPLAHQTTWLCVAAERAVLGAIPYQRNEVVLHTDTTLLPRQRRARPIQQFADGLQADAGERCRHRLSVRVAIAGSLGQRPLDDLGVGAQEFVDLVRERREKSLAFGFKRFPFIRCDPAPQFAEWQPEQYVD